MKNEINLSKEVRKNNTLSYFFRFAGIIFNLIQTKLNLSFLGISLYGTWSTITSIASWANLGDFGIGNGLRNKISSLEVDNNTEEENRYINIASKKLFKISFIVFLIMSLIIEVLLYCNIIDSAIRTPMYITNFFFCFNLYLSIGRSIAYGKQKSWLVSLIQTVTCLLKIFIILIIRKSLTSNLIIFSFLMGATDSVCNLLLLICLLSNNGAIFNKQIQNDNGAFDDLSSLGLRFFILQIGGVILYSTDNIIINRLFSSSSVSEYSIISKVYNTGNDLFSILLISLWSAVTYAIAKKDVDWIIKEKNHILKYWLLYSIGVIIVSLGLNSIIKVWLGTEAISYDYSIIILFAIYNILEAFGSIYVNIANGLGRLKTQLIFCIISIVINIPLSVILANNFNMGIFGVKLATLICKLGSFFIIPIEVSIFLKTTRENNEKN